MKNIWIISDTHFFHDKIIEYCNRPKNHTNKIFKNLMAIPEKDILIHLGDISIGREIEVYEKFIKPLKCTKILVKGNHDRKSNNFYLEHGWDFVCYSFSDTYFNKKILFTHFPKHTDGYDFNIHGHLHSNVYKWEQLTKENKNFINERHLLFAVESTNYRPMKLNYIIDKFEKFQLINLFNKYKEIKENK